MQLTDVEYEDAYAAQARGTASVDDRKLTDREVLEMWWQRDTSEILQGR